MDAEAAGIGIGCGVSDSYQAIYDAVRSRIHSCDVGEIVRSAVGSGIDASHAIAMIQQDFCIAAREMQRPSVLYRPQIRRHEDQWCAFYGNNMDSGVCGFGRTPANAMEAFDRAWSQRVGRVTV